MATIWEIAAHSIDHMFSFVFWLFVILVISHSGFEGWIRVLIASVPDLCILFTFFQVYTYGNIHFLRSCNLWNKRTSPMYIYYIPSYEI